MAVEILHFTDLHLLQDRSAKWCKVVTYDSFRSTVQYALKEFPQPDMIIVTGDISHDKSFISYRNFTFGFDDKKDIVYHLPGNHDDSDSMKKVIGHNQKRIIMENWEILLLDSSMPEKESGYLTRYELNFLSTSLQENTKYHQLICLHHPPISIGSWLDSTQLSNSDEFYNIVRKCQSVKGIIFGHIHQEFQTEVHGISLWGSPSTSIQYKPKAASHELDHINPGFRWLKLNEDGTIETKVRRYSD